MSDGTENGVEQRDDETQPASVQISMDTSCPEEPDDPVLELLRKGVEAVLAASPAKPVHKPPHTPAPKTSDKIPRAILRHSIVLQRKHIEKYIKHINASYSNPTGATLTQFFAYFIEQINIAGTLFTQYFDFNKNTSFKNRFPDFVEYLLSAFTRVREKEGFREHFTSDKLMHMMASCKQDFGSTKTENFYEIKDYLTEYDAKAKKLYATSDYEFYLSFHNYCKSLFTLVRTFISALWIRDANLTSEKEDQPTSRSDFWTLFANLISGKATSPTIENDKNALEGIRISAYI